MGDRGLTVIGPMTGNRYHFEPGGPPVAVDPRDRLAIAGVPHLRELPPR